MCSKLDAWDLLLLRRGVTWYLMNTSGVESCGLSVLIFFLSGVGRPLDARSTELYLSRHMILMIQRVRHFVLQRVVMLFCSGDVRTVKPGITQYVHRNA